ncbi:MAG: hypothetical protein ACLPUT_00790 [Solirubrobacteraceae bacterium]|jgi:hypothetical protein
MKSTVRILPAGVTRALNRGLREQLAIVSDEVGAAACTLAACDGPCPCEVALCKQDRFRAALDAIGWGRQARARLDLSVHGEAALVAIQSTLESERNLAQTTDSNSTRASARRNVETLTRLRRTVRSGTTPTAGAQAAA